MRAASDAAEMVCRIRSATPGADVAVDNPDRDGPRVRLVQRADIAGDKCCSDQEDAGQQRGRAAEPAGHRAGCLVLGHVAEATHHAGQQVPVGPSMVIDPPYGMIHCGSVCPMSTPNTAMAVGW